jgi:hypothetical protein
VSRREPLEEALSRLRAIRDPNSADAREELMNAPSHGASILVERAAKIVADAELEGFETPLKAAFERLLEGGAELDAGCGGKIAVVASLAKLGLPADDVFLKAVHHVQREYKEDTAAGLRARAIVALAESGYGGMLEKAVELLLDPELGARLGAVRALVADGSRAAMLLLRLKALEGDGEAEIVHECLLGLIEREPTSLDFVASFLSRGWVGPAAMALAASRRPEVFKFLKAALDDASERDSQALMLAMAMLRSDESLGFLFEQLNGRDIGVALQAYQALLIYEDDGDLRELLAKAVKASKYRRLFEGPRRAWTE